MPQALYLVPPLYSEPSSDASTSLDRGLSFALSPLNNQAAVFAHSSEVQQEGPNYSSAEPHINLVCIDDTPAASDNRRIFCVDSSISTASFHQTLTKGHKEGYEYPLEHQKYREIAQLRAVDFMNYAKELWVYASKQIERGERATVDPEHYRILKTCFSIFITMELPDVGEEDAVVADHVMEWLNTNFIEPSTEEGDHLSALDRPWEDENFWPYLTRTTMRGLTKATVFFLQCLSEHPSEYARKIASSLAPVLSNHPRLKNFESKRDYAKVWHRWKDSVKSVRVTLDRVPGAARHVGQDDWWNPLSDIVGILEGADEVVTRVCKELGADWKELCAVWCLFVEPGLRRGLLPDHIQDNCVSELPHDSTNPEDSIHFYLLTRQHEKALAEAAKFDIWLAAHLAMFMEPLQLLHSDPSDEEELTLREQYLLSYAEYLHSDATLWRIVTQYMYTCGPIGQARADEVLVRVSARLSKRDAQKERQAGEVEHVADDDHQEALRALSETSAAYSREHVRRTICRIAARKFVAEKDYARAISFYISAEDSIGVARVVDQILEEFIARGPEVFTRFVVEQITSCWQKFGSHPGLNGVFWRRLVFVVCYAEFHRHRMDSNHWLAARELVGMFRNETVPKSWWGVLLCDALDLLNHSGPMLIDSPDATMLMHRLEEIHIRASQGSGDDYLSVLVRTTKVAGEQEAILSLRPVRLALARYHARCAVLGVGGKELDIRRAPASASSGQNY